MGARTELAATGTAACTQVDRDVRPAAPRCAANVRRRRRADGRPTTSRPRARTTWSAAASAARPTGARRPSVGRESRAHASAASHEGPSGTSRRTRRPRRRPRSAPARTGTATTAWPHIARAPSVLVRRVVRPGALPEPPRTGADCTGSRTIRVGSARIRITAARRSVPIADARRLAYTTRGNHVATSRRPARGTEPGREGRAHRRASTCGTATRSNASASGRSRSATARSACAATAGSARRRRARRAAPRSARPGTPTCSARSGGCSARRRAPSRVDIVLAPTVNLHRKPLAGRNFECYSEDPFLTARARGRACIDGRPVDRRRRLHQALRRQRQRVPAAHDLLRGRRAGAARAVPACRSRRRSARPRSWSVMSAYNRLNGTYCAEHHWLLDDVLRERVGLRRAWSCRTGGAR